MNWISSSNQRSLKWNNSPWSSSHPSSLFSTFCFVDPVWFSLLLFPCIYSEMSDIKCSYHLGHVYSNIRKIWTQPICIYAYLFPSLFDLLLCFCVAKKNKEKKNSSSHKHIRVTNRTIKLHSMPTQSVCVGKKFPKQESEDHRYEIHDIYETGKRTSSMPTVCQTGYPMTPSSVPSTHRPRSLYTLYTHNDNIWW